MIPNNQPSLFPGDIDVARQTVKFHGSELDEKRDAPRLGKQLQAVFDIMVDGDWWTVEKVFNSIKITHPNVGWKVTSIDRQMRYLKDIDGWTTETESRGERLYVKRLVKEE